MKGLALLNRIAVNTDRLKAIEEYLGQIRNAQRDMRDNGIKMRTR